MNTQINITKNGTTTLATEGKYCDKNIDVRVEVDDTPAYEAGERLDFIRSMAQEKGVNPSALVVAWLTNLYRLEGFPKIIPLFSATPEQMKQNLRGLELTLTDEELEMMNNVL